MRPNQNIDARCHQVQSAIRGDGNSADPVVEEDDGKEGEEEEEQEKWVWAEKQEDVEEEEKED